MDTVVESKPQEQMVVMSLAIWKTTYGTKTEASSQEEAKNPSLRNGKP